jgi:hypothetical protein
MWNQHKEAVIIIESIGKAAKKLFPYNIALIAVFFLLPVFASFQQNEDAVATVLTISLLKVNPETSFITAMVFGLKNGFRWAYPLVVGGWFLIAIFLYFFNISFLLFLIIYMVCATAGCWFGSIFKSHRDEMYL